MGGWLAEEGVFLVFWDQGERGGGDWHSGELWV